MNSVEIAPFEEMLEMQPSLKGMFDNLEKQSRERTGCAGYTTVILMAGPVARPLPVMLNDDLRGTDFDNLKVETMSMLEWKDTLNKVV